MKIVILFYDNNLDIYNNSNKRLLLLILLVKYSFKTKSEVVQVERTYGTKIVGTAVL